MKLSETGLCSFCKRGEEDPPVFESEDGQVRICLICVTDAMGAFVDSLLRRSPEEREHAPPAAQRL